MATSNAATTYLERRILDYLFKNDSLSFATPGNSIYIGLATAVSSAESGNLTEVNITTEDASYTRQQVTAADWKQSTTSLSKGIGTADTEVQATDAEAFPTSGTIQIEDELITYTGKDGTATADANGAVSASTALTVDNNNGTITVGMIVTGSGIVGTVKVATVTTQQSLVLDTAITISDNVALSFDGTNTLTGCVRGAASTTAANHVTADVDGAVTASTSLTVDNVSGTLVVGQQVRGTGITGIVRIATVNSQTSLVLDTAITIADNVPITFDADAVISDQQQVINDNNVEFAPSSGIASYTVTHAFVADKSFATALVNSGGGISSTRTIPLDGNVGTIAVGDVVTGTGISGIVTVDAVASQNSITVSSAVTLADNAKLKFDGSNVLFVGELDVSKTIASGDIFRINSGNLSVELK
jgi:ribosomal 30S subunit maturation factor RimM